MARLALSEADVAISPILESLVFGMCHTSLRKGGKGNGEDLSADVVVMSSYFALSSAYCYFALQKYLLLKLNIFSSPKAKRA